MLGVSVAHKVKFYPLMVNILQQRMRLSVLKLDILVIVKDVLRIKNTNGGYENARRNGQK